MSKILNCVIVLNLKDYKQIFNLLQTMHGVFHFCSKNQTFKPKTFAELEHMKKSLTIYKKKTKQKKIQNWVKTAKPTRKNYCFSRVTRCLKEKDKNLRRHRQNINRILYRFGRCLGVVASHVGRKETSSKNGDRDNHIACNEDNMPL